MSLADKRLVAAFNPPIKNDVYTWIGIFTVLWSQIEFLVEVGIYGIKGLSIDEGRKIPLPNDITSKAKKLKALAGDNCTDIHERKALIALCSSIIGLAESRNLVTHGYWVHLSDHDGEPAAVSWFKVEQGEKIKTLRPSNLPLLAEEVATVSKELYDLLNGKGVLPGDQN